MSSLDALVLNAEQNFVERFGRPPRWVVAAPGRANLIGEHTDYNDGFVLPLAIERHVVIAADRLAPRAATTEAPTIRLLSEATNQWAAIPLNGAITPGPIEWARYVRGVVAGFIGFGIRPEPFDAIIYSDLPIGGGLSSSAALEVATATLLEAITGVTLEPLAKALLCQKAEHEFAGVPCGIMDQCSSVMGIENSLLLLDCRAQTVQPVPLDPSLTILIINSNVKHALTDGGYASRRQQCEEAAKILGVPALRDATPEEVVQAGSRLGDVVYRRARHVTREIARTLQAVEAIRSGEWPRVGTLMYDSHASLRDDFQVSCPELDVLVEAAAKIGMEGGVIGSRMTGGGFGGCTISLVRKEMAHDIAERITTTYHQAMGREAAWLITRPAAGARVIRSNTV